MASTTLPANIAVVRLTASVKGLPTPKAVVSNILSLCYNNKMQLESGPDNKFLATFTEPECRVIGAVYLARLAELADSGKLEPMSEGAERIRTFTALSRAPQDAAENTTVSHEVSTEDLRDIRKTVDEFARKTGEEISHIKRSTTTPPHENHAMADRLDLGMVAAELAVCLEMETDLDKF